MPNEHKLALPEMVLRRAFISINSGLAVWSMLLFFFVPKAQHKKIRTRYAKLNKVVHEVTESAVFWACVSSGFVFSRAICFMALWSPEDRLNRIGIRIIGGYSIVHFSALYWLADKDQLSATAGASSSADSSKSGSGGSSTKSAVSNDSTTIKSPTQSPGVLGKFERVLLRLCPFLLVANVAGLYRWGW